VVNGIWLFTRRFMYKPVWGLVLLSCLGLAVSGFAQQGHPLTGTWTGDWGPTPTQRNPITLVLDWDGKQVNGQMNPGPDSVKLASVYVDPTNWTVRIEADSKSGHIAAEGKLEDIGSYHRTLKGSWTQGTVKGDFKLTRD
jgi:hypothetical protein